jgi:K+-sensing histidine kinase KdpD
LKKKPKVMVCVTRQKTCERLIKIGAKIASENKGELFVVHVAKEGVKFLGSPDEGEALEYLFQISKRANAAMSVLRSNNIEKTLEEFARKNEISTIIMGESPALQSSNNIIKKLEHNLPEIKFKVVSA